MHQSVTPAAVRMLTLFTRPLAMGWSDLGMPERLIRWIGRDVAHEIAS